MEQPAENFDEAILLKYEERAKRLQAFKETTEKAAATRSESTDQLKEALTEIISEFVE